MTTQTDLARTFAALHVAGDPLVLSNVWDGASARVVAASGARAIATTSAGVAWSLGFADGNRMTRDDAVEALARIARVMPLPLSADIERGYGETPAEVAETIEAVIATGAVGVNLEDSLRPVAEHTRRIAAARDAADRAGVPLFINARIDTHGLGGLGGDAWLDETVERACAYAEAGASGVFVLGPLPAVAVSALVAATTAPVNVAFGPGTLKVAEIARAGAARISAGSAIAEDAYSLVARWASRMSDATDATSIAPPHLGWGGLNAVMRDR